MATTVIRTIAHITLTPPTIHIHIGEAIAERIMPGHTGVIAERIMPGHIGVIAERIMPGHTGVIGGPIGADIEADTGSVTGAPMLVGAGVETRKGQG